MPPPTTDPAPDWRMANCRTRRIGRGTDEEQPEQRTTERKRPSCLMERIRRKRIHTLAFYGMQKVSRNWIALRSRSRLNSFWHPSGCHFAVESFRQHADDDGPVNKQRDVGGNGLLSIQLLLFLFASRLCFTVVVNRPDRPDLLLENYGKTCMPLTSLPSSSSSYFGAGP